MRLALGFCVALLLLGGTVGTASAQDRVEDLPLELIRLRALTEVEAGGRAWLQDPRAVGAPALIRRTALYFACVGFYVLAAVLLVLASFAVRGIAPIALACYAALIAVHTAAGSGALPFAVSSFFDDRSVGTLEAASYLLVNGAVAFVLWSAFRGAFYPSGSGRSAAMNTGIVALAAVSSVVFAAVQVASPDTIGSLALSRWISLPLMILAAWLGWQALRDRRPAQTAIALGLTFLVAGMLYDALNGPPSGADRPYVLPFLSLGFVALFGMAIARRAVAGSAHPVVADLTRPAAETDAADAAAGPGSDAWSRSEDIARAAFVTSITHELRTPLTSMVGYIQLLRDELEGSLTGPQQEFLETLESSGERLLNLVNDLLHLARLESGRTELVIEPIDMAAVVRSVLAELYPLAREKGIHLRSETTTDDPIANADEHWIELVLTNLVSNAVKYTREGGVIVRISDGELSSRTAVAVHVIDTGLGISEGFMPHMFDRFTREEDAQLYAPTGTGLGLTISREVLVRMGGEIRVESTKGEGSTFTILLPRARE